MAFTAKPLADGQLDTTSAELYAAPTNVYTYVKRLSFYNTNATDQTILVYLNRSGVSRLFRSVSLVQDDWVDLLEDGASIMLYDGDSIEAETTTATAVNYFVDGVEES
jgi:hypothetical protein